MPLSIKCFTRYYHIFYRGIYVYWRFYRSKRADITFLHRDIFTYSRVFRASQRKQPSSRIKKYCGEEIWENEQLKHFFPEHLVFAIEKISWLELFSRFFPLSRSMYITFMNGKGEKTLNCACKFVNNWQERSTALTETFVWAYIIYREPDVAIRVAFITYRVEVV